MTIKRAILAAPILFGGWLFILISVGLITDSAPASVVLFPSKSFIENLPENVAIISTTSYSLTLSSDMKEFAHALYSNGAWIVLPAGLTGCLPLVARP